MSEDVQVNDQTDLTEPMEDASAGGRQSPVKFLIGGAIIVAVVAYLIISSIGGSTTYYQTVAELRGQGDQGVGKKVRVVGLVDGDSIQFNEQALDLRFEINDESGSMPVSYHGARPDMLREGAEAVVEGRLQADGTFAASELLLKCPSKYEAAATTEASSK